RLKDGEISVPVKSERFGFFLIRMEKRRGDDADVRMILRVPPVTETEINQAKSRLDSIKGLITSGQMTFNDAAVRFSDDEMVKFNGPFFTNRDGSYHVTLDQLDKETVAALRNLNVGDMSASIPYVSDQGKKGVRIIYLKSRTDPH